MMITFPACDAIVCKDRPSWLANRRLGASDSAGILGEGYAGQSRYSIWSDKSGNPVEELDEKRLKIGKLMEPSLRKIFEEETGLVCHDPGEHTILVSREWPFMSATLDGVAVCDDRGPLPVELKNVGHFMGDEWESQGPLKYQIQVQHQLAVTGAEAAYLFGLIGGNEPVAILVERNDKFIAGLVEQLRQFWELVESGTPPEVDGSEATASVLKRLHPEDNGEAVILPQESLEWDSELSEVKRQLKELSDRERLLKNKLVSAIGDCTFGVLPDGNQYTHKTQTRKAYEVKEASFRVLRKAKGTK